MSLLDPAAVLEAAHIVYANEYASLCDERGRPLQGEATSQIERLPDAEQLPIVWRLIGRIEGIWGHDLGLVFYHAGIGPEDQAHALADLLLGIGGCGVGIEDDFAEHIAKAFDVLRIEDKPIYYEPLEWRELAERELDKT